MTQRLPGVLGEIADLIGEVGALNIAAQKGGTRVYFPARVDDTHWLAAVVGIDNARKLCDHFAVDGSGQRIEIPLFVGGSYKQFIRELSKRLHALDADGASEREIARKLGVSQRSVRRHRSRHRSDKQGRLL